MTESYDVHIPIPFLHCNINMYPKKLLYKLIIKPDNGTNLTENH